MLIDTKWTAHTYGNLPTSNIDMGGGGGDKKAYIARCKENVKFCLKTRQIFEFSQRVLSASVWMAYI